MRITPSFRGVFQQKHEHGIHRAISMYLSVAKPAGERGDRRATANLLIRLKMFFNMMIDGFRIASPYGFGFRNDAVWLVVFACLVLPISACGHKGKLKTPSQVEAEEQKKARKEAKKAEEKKENPSPLAGEGKGGGASANFPSPNLPPPNLPPQGGEK